MTLLGRALRGVERRDSTLARPSWDLIEALGSGASYSGRTVSVEASLRIVPVFSAIQLLAGAVGSLPLVVYRRVDNGRERATNHWLWSLLHEQPNPAMAADEVWELVTGHLLSWGNAYLAKVKLPDTPYPVDELWPIRPERVTIKIDRDTGERKFIVDGQEGSALTASDVLHIRAFGTDGVYGLSPIRQARQMLGSVADMEEFSGRFWGQGAVASVVVRHPKQLSAQAHQNLRTSVKRHLGAKAGGEPFVLEEDADIKTLTMPLEDAQFIEQRKQSLLDVALLMRVPPKMLGASTGDSLTYTSSEWESLDFVRWSLRRLLVRIEGSLKRDLDLFVQGRRFYPEFLIEAVLRGTSQERAAFYEKALDPVKGWMQRAEVRELENLPPESTAPVVPTPAPPAPQIPMLNGKGQG